LGGDEDAISRALDGGTKKRSSGDVVAEALGREPKRKILTSTDSPNLILPGVVSSSSPRKDEVLEWMEGEVAGK
jgi:hypothetical protein